MATRTTGGEGAWTVRRAGAAAGARRGRAAGPPDVPAVFLQSPDVTVSEVLVATPTAAAARRAAPPDLALEVDLAPGEASLLVVRHASGALTFHRSSERAVRGRRGAGAAAGRRVAQFRVPIRQLDGDSGRRGIVSSAIKAAVLKVAKSAIDKAVSVALPKLAAVWEKRVWTKRGLAEGWFQVTPAAGDPAGLRLAPGVPAPGPRTLLLLHGTFSNAASAFGDLARSDFFTRVSSLYGPRMFAFNHFSISKSPQDNARDLLQGLPPGDHLFDVVTHSRGGLVLRTLVEQRQLHGSPAQRFGLGHAVLVASPNDGTPLATPTRWEETVGWLANLLELFPDNPFTTGAEYVSEAIVWLAAHLAGDLPGLRAMDGAGPLVAALQAPPGPPAAGAYSALVANVHPDDGLFKRALDVGVDSFFASANDLVVPSEGGWRTDREGSSHVPAARIGCFGPGGNIAPGGATVNHVSFFDRAESATFLAKAFRGEAQGLPAIDPEKALPNRRFTRGLGAGVAAAGGAAAALAAAPEEAVVSATAAAPVGPGGAVVAAAAQGVDDLDAFHIVVLEDLPDDGPAEAKQAKTKRAKTSRKETKEKLPRFARVLASYGGARVAAAMRLHLAPGEPPTAFGRIIELHEQISAYTNREEGTLPSDAEMMNLGSLLFETLFQGDVRRLYDEARSRQRERRLDLVLTSMISWIAEKPWEFAYDAGRRSFLATEEVHFVRNVLTSVPADLVPPVMGPLRILVASAQPVGFGELSIKQEEEVIRRGFAPLEEAGLVTVKPLARATPSALHRELAVGGHNIVHFIGHGVFENGEGFLVFEDPEGGAVKLGERSVREIFCRRGISLVFLNSCQSGTGGRADFNKGVAQSLVAHGLPALVANQYSVLDSSATSFAQQFYGSLAQGKTLGEAAREARIAVNYSLDGELIDWAIPVLYARDAKSRLCAPAAAGAQKALPATTVPKSRRNAIVSRPRRIAVWDVDDGFPYLQDTLDRLNAVQSAFGFELVHMSAPLDAWDLTQDKEVPYLWAEKLARRLQSKTVELRVSLLVCITRHWLRDDDWVNLYGWWPVDKKPRVAILSYAGLTGLEPSGPRTDRAIANAMASVLAGFFGSLGTHPRGDTRCPLYFNEQREEAHIVGAQRFDAKCRKSLQTALPKELPALEAILGAFPG